MVDSGKAHLKFTPPDSISINLASNETARSVVTIENTGEHSFYVLLVGRWWIIPCYCGKINVT